MKSPRPTTAAEPWIMPQVPRTVVYAAKAIAAGKASEGQQKLFLSWITFDLCRVTKDVFDPRTDKVDGQRVTDYSLGMQAVARTIAWIVQTPVKGDQDQEIPSAGTIEQQA